MSVLLVGHKGYIGSEFRRQLDASVVIHKTFSWKYWKSVARQFDVIVNAAGYVGKPNVDACETAKDECIRGNVLFPEMLAQACELGGTKLVHVSSGCIYNGYDKDFSETDEPNFSFQQNNCSFYSGTKALAEQRLVEYPNVYITRLRIPFDCYASPRNYITKVLSYDTLLDTRNSLSHRSDYVSATLELLDKGCPTGIYNVTNPGSVTTSDVTDLLKKYGHDKDFKFFESLEEFNKNVVAPRSNCVLDTTKLEQVLTIRSAVDALEETIKNYKECV